MRPPCCWKRRTAVFAVFGRQHLVSVTLQRFLRQLADNLFVVHHQYGSLAVQALPPAVRAGFLGARLGRRENNLERAALARRARHANAAADARAQCLARQPSPEPRPVNLVVKNGSKILRLGGFIHAAAGIVHLKTNIDAGLQILVLESSPSGNSAFGFDLRRGDGDRSPASLPRIASAALMIRFIDQLLHLAGVGIHRRQVVAQIQFEFHLARNGGLDQRRDVADHRARD